MRLTTAFWKFSFATDLHAMKKMIIVIVIAIIVLNAIVLLQGLSSHKADVEECSVAIPKIELKEVRPGLIPNLLKF